jgi:hypothetical protein
VFVRSLVPPKTPSASRFGLLLVSMGLELVGRELGFGGASTTMCDELGRS